MSTGRSNQPDALIACGMYAPTAALRAAWKALFRQLSLTGYHPSARLAVTFRTDQRVYQQRNLFIGQTCGYPYVKLWHKTHSLVCVPVFDVEGCQGPRYSSWFITSAKHPANNLSEMKNAIVAVNDRYSNSGMNVLRYAISKLAKGGTYFKSVLTSGSHLNSLQWIAQRKVDLAAIDAVTFSLAKAENLVDFGKIRIIGQSEMTCGLPFIVPGTGPPETDTITEAFNRALSRLDPASRQCLAIRHFEPVKDSQYHTIRQLASDAVKRGYPHIR